MNIFTIHAVLYRYFATYIIVAVYLICISACTSPHNDRLQSSSVNCCDMEFFELRRMDGVKDFMDIRVFLEVNPNTSDDYHLLVINGSLSWHQPRLELSYHGDVLWKSIYGKPNATIFGVPANSARIYNIKLMRPVSVKPFILNLDFNNHKPQDYNPDAVWISGIGGMIK